MKRIQKTILRFLLLTLMSFSSLVYATTETGLAWLSAQVSSDNNYTANTKIATTLQSLSEMQTAFILSGGASSTVLLEQINANDYNSTEYLSRKVQAKKQAGQNYYNELNLLLKNQTFNGSFAEQEGFNGTILDTAYALEILSETSIDVNILSQAVSFLMSSQNSDGSWSEGKNASQLELTAISMHALWKLRHKFNVASAVDTAKAYILSQRQNNGLWGTNYKSALALIAISVTYDTNESLVSSVEALEQTQQINGSWDNDIYTSSLILQALLLSSKSTPNPDLGSIQGKIIDDTTGLALGDVRVTLSSVDVNRSINSNAQGEFEFTSLSANSYILVIQKDGFSSIQSQITFIGEDINFGEVRLKQLSSSTIASIQGVVKDAQTQLPIMNARVRAGNKETLTDSTGSYQISNITPGSTVVKVDAVNYISSQTTINVQAGFIVQYPINLNSADSVNADIKGAIQGFILDDETTEFINDAKIVISDGNNTTTLFSNTDGNFNAENLKAGTYRVSFEKDGYSTIYGTFSIDKTEVINFGTIRLKLFDPDVIDPISMSGVITDSITKAPISDVLINVNGLTVQSGIDGRYFIDNLPEGNVSITMSKGGYESIMASSTLSLGSALIFSPSLKSSTQATRVMSGTILDANSYVALEDVNVTLSGAINTSVLTDEKGYYYIEDIPLGEVSISVAKAEYKTITLDFVVENNNVEFSPSLQKESQVLDESISLTGIVNDISTGEVLEGVQIFVNDVYSNQDTGLDGRFTLEDITSSEVTITLKKNQYKDIELMFVFTESQVINLGTLGMRLEGTDDLKSDIVAESISTSALVQNSNTLEVVGDINISIANRGTLKTNAFDVFAFYDMNADGNYSNESDRIIAEYRVSESIEVQGLKQIVLSINTTADFRDQPISIIVDAKNENIELDEENNLNTTAKSCGGKQGSIDLGVCFDYSGSVRSYMHIQKNGLIQALRDPSKFPRDGSIRLTVMTGQGRGLVFQEPVVITAENADEIADKLESTGFYGYDYMGDCLKTMTDMWNNLEDQSSYRAVTLSGDGVWGGYGAGYNNLSAYRGYRDYAISNGVDVIDAIGIGRVNMSLLETVVYPQPAGGEYGVVSLARTSDEISNSLVRGFKNQTKISDLTIGKLTVIDNGTDANISLRFRVGNAGLASISDSIEVAVYEGDPKLNGVLLKSVKVDQNISAGMYIEMSIEDVALQEGGELYVVGDANNNLVECTKLNNVISTTLKATATLGKISINTDKLIYAASEDVNLTASITNPGRLSYLLKAKLEVTDINGHIVKSFTLKDMGLFNSLEVKNTSELWNTGTTIAGNYKAHAILLDTNNNIVDEAYADFTISNTGTIGSGTTASLRTNTDKPVYHTTDTLVIENLIQNLAVNNIIEDAVLKIDLMDPSGTQIYTQNITLGSLLPSAMRQSPLTLPFVSALEGIYTIKGTLLGKSGSSLASTSTTCEVKENLSQALLGEVSAQFDLIERGTQQVCRASVVHNGKVNISNLNLRQLLVSADTEAEVGNKAAITNLDAGQTYSFTYDFATQSMVEGEYLCILQAQINGTWETLAHDTYTLVRPPIEIDSLMQTGSHGPLLVLLDSPVEYGWCLGIFATGFHGHDPYGPKDAPLLVEQRAYLENLLDAHGYNYTIVDSEADFKRELRSGNYSTYALFNEYINMSSQTLSEIREAVYRGDGLLFAGKHQYCNDELEKPLGLDFRNTHDHVTNMTMIDTAEYSPSDISLAFEDKATRFRLKGAEALGSFEIKSSFFNFCPDDEKYSLTRNKYKNGRGVFAAFDLLMQAATPGAPAEVERILLEALDDIQPDVYNASIGSVYPIHMNMVNKQIATQGYTETRITGASVLDAGKGVFDTNTSLLNWRFTLSEDGTDSLDYWIKIPNGSAHVDIETSIYTGETGLENFYESITHTIAVDTSTYFSLQDALDASNAVGSWSLNTTEYHIKKAIYDEGQGDYSRALSHAIDAADCLAGMTSPEADVIRGKLAQAIRALSAKI